MCVCILAISLIINNSQLKNLLDLGLHFNPTQPSWQEVVTGVGFLHFGRRNQAFRYKGERRCLSSITSKVHGEGKVFLSFFLACFFSSSLDEKLSSSSQRGLTMHETQDQRMKVELEFWVSSFVWIEAHFRWVFRGSKFLSTNLDSFEANWILWVKTQV
jgi:hypothetical protein